jgi:hypothetical protein
MLAIYKNREQTATDLIPKVDNAVNNLPPCTGLEPATCWLTAYQNHDDFIGFCCLGKDFSGAIGPKIDGISRIAV